MVALVLHLIKVADLSKEQEERQSGGVELGTGPLVIRQNQNGKDLELCDISMSYIKKNIDLR